MGLVLADLGADCILKAFFNNVRPAGGNNLTLKLFCNDVTPGDTDTSSTYTEASGGGYAARVLTNGSWTINSANDPSDVVYATQNFPFTGPLTTNTTVYGYYVVDADGVLQWAERFTTSFTPTASGDYINVTPSFQLSNGAPA